MPRPNLKDQRSREILDAFVTSAARFGLEGATQERIAAEAGMKRTLLRHYLGNRDEMIAALAEHVVSEFEAMLGMLREYARQGNGIHDLVGVLFDPQYQTDTRLILVYQALISSVPDHPEMRTPLLTSMENFTALIAGEARKSFPGARKADCESVALGLVAMYASCDTHAPLNPPAEWRDGVRRAAFKLIDTLEEKKS
ncbi:MAG: TetR/AcrR family transcriptional regulator [Hyphomicrobiaceae bacterium]